MAETSRDGKTVLDEERQRVLREFEERKQYEKTLHDHLLTQRYDNPAARPTERTKSMFMIVAEPPPTCEILTSTGEEERAKWLAALFYFNRERQWYNEQYNTDWNPPIWRWVSKETWRILSADLLLPEDATDPTKGEPPNNEAVTDLLLRRGKYYHRLHSKAGAYGYGSARSRFKTLKWPMYGIMSHTARLDIFLDKWYDLALTVRTIFMPTDKELSKTMLAAVQPKMLRDQIQDRIHNGCPPSFHMELKREKWRMEATKHFPSMRRLIREHTTCVDRLVSRANGNNREMGWEVRQWATVGLDASTWGQTTTDDTDAMCTASTDPLTKRTTPQKQQRQHKSRAPAAQRKSRQERKRKVHHGDTPICCLEECTKPCHQYAHGHYATTCTRAHHKIHRERQRRVKAVPDY